MNWISHRNRLEKQMLLYLDFLPFLQQELAGFGKKEIEKQRFKLLDEIQFLKMQIQRIDRMTINMASNTVFFSLSKKQSKLNV